MSVRAKFYVSNVGIHSIDANGEPRGGTVSMSPVCRGAVNKQWAQATPAGRVELTINGPAVGYFMQRVGKELSITFDDAGNDPATHPFVALEADFQPTPEQVKAGYRPDETCVECGHPKGSHQ